jgi:hypothetical protein
MNCVKCNKPIEQDRLEALAILSKPAHEYTCLSCAPQQRIKGLFLGESGNSQLLFVNNVGRDGIEKDNQIYTSFDATVSQN